jgi:FkbM family methyltransferase
MVPERQTSSLFPCARAGRRPFLMAAPRRVPHAGRMGGYSLRLKNFAVCSVARAAPSALRFLAHASPFERVRWPVLRALMGDPACREWLASLENPTRTRRGFGIYTLPGDLTSDWIKLHGQHEIGTERFLLDHLEPGTTFMDIGANIGYFSLLAAFVAGSRVVSFEPQPEVAGLLRRSAAHNGVEGLVRVEGLALSDGPAVMRMTSCPGNTGHSQLAQAGQEGALPYPVQVAALDDWLEANPAGPVSACKIDTEGTELRVLLGMRRLLERDGPALVIEMTDEFSAGPVPDSPRIRQLLLGCGYTEVTGRYALGGERNSYFSRSRTGSRPAATGGPRQGAPTGGPAGRTEGRG